MTCRPIWLLAAIAAALPAFAAPAFAEQIFVSDVEVPLHAGGVSLQYGSLSYTDVIAGQIVLTANYGAALASPAFDVYAWCVDLYHDVYIGGGKSYKYIIGGLVTDDGNGNAVSPAVAAQLATLAAYGNALLAGPSAGDPDVSSAIQLAIWQTEYPGMTFSANPAVTANVALFEAYAAEHPMDAASLVSLDGAQALITTTIGVPEPMSPALLGVGLVALGLIRRRRAT